MKFYTNVHLYKGDFLIRGFEGNERVQYTVPCEPYLFTTDRVSVEEYKTLQGRTVFKKVFDSPYDARNYIKENSDISGKEIYGMTNWVYPFINEHYSGVIDYDVKKVSVVSIDIEIEADGGFPDISLAEKPLTAITIAKNGKYTVFGYHEYRVEDKNVTYIRCKDEGDLLSRFIATWRSSDFHPDIITGWNVEFFDMPYIINRITRLMGEESAKRLSPWGLLSQREVEIAGKTFNIPIIVGSTILDYLQLHKKFSFSNQESYKLDHIAFVELGEKKLDYNALGYDNLNDFYKHDFQNYINYNIRDVQLVDRLEDKLKFIEQVLALAYDAKVNYLDTFTSVRMWDIIIHNYLFEQGIVVPNFDVADRKEKDRQIVGAYVKDPQLGMHKWVVSFDLNSLYPHLIMQYNISPETYKGMLTALATDTGIEKILSGALNEPALRQKLTDQNLTIAASGCFFDRDRQGFLPRLMEQMYNDRVKYKKLMIEAKKKLELIDAELKRRDIET